MILLCFDTFYLCVCFCRVFLNHLLNVLCRCAWGLLRRRPELLQNSSKAILSGNTLTSLECDNGCLNHLQSLQYCDYFTSSLHLKKGCKQMIKVGHLKTVRRSKQIIKRSHVVNLINCWQHAGEAVGSQLECLSREICYFWGCCGQTGRC